MPGSTLSFLLDGAVSLFDGPHVARRVMRPSVAAVLAATVLLLVSLPAAARFGMPDALTKRGQTIEDIFSKIMVVGILVFVLVFVLLVWVLVRYREGTGHGKATHERHRGSIKAELVWTIIPLAIMLWIGVMSYAGLVKLDAGLGAQDAEMEVQVVGRQWLWEMHYPNGVQTTVIAQADAHGNLTYSDTFHLPADTPILLNLTGGDVIHAFNILDGNRAYVTMDDANPWGPHKYHRQVYSFPAGNYHIQCKEMCLNPGHGYMRANLIVEPRAAFDAWLADAAMCTGADLCERVSVTAKAGTLTYGTPAPAVAVNGSRIAVKVDNQGPDVLTVRLDGAERAAVPAGQVGRFAFEVSGSNRYNVSFSPVTKAKDSFFVVESVVPDDDTIVVDLKDYRLDPPAIKLQVGKGYLITAKNLGGTGHNLYMGTYGGEVVARSATINGGQDAKLYYKPTAPATLDMWCNVPGHAGLGMKGTVTIE